MSLRTGLKAAMAALAGVMAVSALASCSVDIGPLQHRTESYSVYGPLRTLVVNAHVGSVQITGGNSGQVSVTEQISFRHNAPVTTHRTNGRHPYPGQQLAGPGERQRRLRHQGSHDDDGAGQ